MPTISTGVYLPQRYLSFRVLAKERAHKFCSPEEWMTGHVRKGAFEACRLDSSLDRISLFIKQCGALNIHPDEDKWFREAIKSEKNRDWTEGIMHYSGADAETLAQFGLAYVAASAASISDSVCLYYSEQARLPDSAALSLQKAELSLMPWINASAQEVKQTPEEFVRFFRMPRGRKFYEAQTRASVLNINPSHQAQIAAWTGFKGPNSDHLNQAVIARIAFETFFLQMGDVL